MTTAFEALHARLIDYAGLFPPAELPLDVAIRSYARYRAEDEAWMLGRFICPAGQLAQLAPFHDELLTAGAPFEFSVLGRGGADLTSFVANLEADLGDIAAFVARHSGRALVQSYEVRAPAGLLASAGFLHRVITLLENAPARPQQAFFEATFASDWRSAIGSVVASLAAANAGFGVASRLKRSGFKLRCGGVEAAAFPPPAQIAAAIIACRDAGVALKCTAGLHHPLRHFNAGVATKMHGFVNVFGGGVLAHAREMGESQLTELLADEDASHFRFTGASFGWRAIEADAAEIEAARGELMIAFGSCSFDEPREDLRALGLL